MIYVYIFRCLSWGFSYFAKADLNIRGVTPTTWWCKLNMMMWEDTRHHRQLSEEEDWKMCGCAVPHPGDRGSGQGIETRGMQHWLFGGSGDNPHPPQARPWHQYWKPSDCGIYVFVQEKRIDQDDRWLAHCSARGKRGICQQSANEFAVYPHWKNTCSIPQKDRSW